MHRWLALVLGALLLGPGPAAARITRIEITHVAPAFGGRSFGAVGPYERVTGEAYGEVDPASPANVLIQDIALAPRNARGMVEYRTDIDILRPADPARGNRVLFFNILNRGNHGGFALFNADVQGAVNRLEDAGDGWLQRQGYTSIWFGWQGDVLPGDGRMLFHAPVARHADGSPVTGVVRSELLAGARQVSTLNLSSGWFTGMTHESYPPVNLDNRARLSGGFRPSLTVRTSEAGPRIPIASAAWRFGRCTADGGVIPDAQHICYPAGFRPGLIYELIYRARDPKVLGLGFAAARDLGAFLRAAAADDAGTPNPVAHGPAIRTLLMGTSQSGRMVRTLINLGFNRSEDGRRVFDGALPHIAAGRLPLNVRFGQPGRAWGQQIDHLYPGYEFPFAYATQTDPITGHTGGILDRCRVSDTCPRIIHAATALELWAGRASLDLTDPLGRRDAAEPANVRSYIMASTQHGPAAFPLPRRHPFGDCEQQPNPNRRKWTMRALLSDLTEWVRDGRAPPASRVPRIADGTLVRADAVRFPEIPANDYGGIARPAVRYLAATNPLGVLDFGQGFRAVDTSGVITVEPPRIGRARYAIMVPQVDADGIDIGGIRDLYLRVPVGTYTGWNNFRAGMFGGGFCGLSGSFIPFAPTRAAREAIGDPRLSLAERYPTPEAYVGDIRRAAAALVAERFLLPEDADRLVGEAEAHGLRAGP